MVADNIKIADLLINVFYLTQLFIYFLEESNCLEQSLQFDDPLAGIP